eukprot:14409677-Alexandrium_andersonii.AAC.1
MAPRTKKAGPEEPLADGAEAEGEEGRGGVADLKAAIVEQLHAKLAQSLDLQLLRPALAATVAQKLLGEGLASKLSVQSIADRVAGELGKELALKDTALRALVVQELVAKLAG